MRITRKTFLKYSGLPVLVLISKKIAGAFGAAAQPSAAQPAPKRWAMVVDTHKCLKKEGCTACMEACNRIHNVPHFDDRAHEVKWIWKEPFEDVFPYQTTGGDQGGLIGEPVMVLCNHCNNPPCVRVCPTQATWRRDDGIVMMDYHRCIGCRYCMAACPYGSRSFNWLDPRPHIHQLSKDFPTRTRGVVEKCNLCEERLAEGRLPICVEACPEKALVFGDYNDRSSEVRQLIDSRFVIRRKPELGTNPETYYIV